MLIRMKIQNPSVSACVWLFLFYTCYWCPACWQSIIKRELIFRSLLSPLLSYSHQRIKDSNLFAAAVQPSLSSQGEKWQRSYMCLGLPYRCEGLASTLWTSVKTLNTKIWVKVLVIMYTMNLQSHTSARKCQCNERPNALHCLLNVLEKNASSAIQGDLLSKFKCDPPPDITVLKKQCSRRRDFTVLWVVE